MKELKLSFCLLQICRLQDIIEEVDRKTGEAKVVWFTAVLLFFFSSSFQSVYVSFFCQSVLSFLTRMSLCCSVKMYLVE